MVVQYTSAFSSNDKKIPIEFECWIQWRWCITQLELIWMPNTVTVMH